ncbi:transmembrane domain-containing protein [Cryptosporidium canis]|uniref:Transmembrane domain-containing protein n=1 Tax=Cryptosporidium canis TaxID=195482 RepID=A0A9D5DID5_9CRYT|nr:transmembrane domain-containing protein [Cryptosporidium canis]
MKSNEIWERIRNRVKTRVEDFRQGRHSWRLKEWHHLQSLVYLIYGVASLIFVRLIANSNPDNNYYDHFVNDPSDPGSSFTHCGITPMFNIIPIPGSYLLIIYSIYALSAISLAISVLSFISGFSFKFFSRIPRSHFFSPSKRTKVLGFCCKILPIIVRILNLFFILFLIIPFIYITTSGACYRRLVRFERNKVQNCRIWVNKCAKDHRIFGRHLECSLRKNFKHFPTEIVEDPTIGENLDIIIGGPMPLLCPMCNEVRMDPSSPLYKGEAYVEQLKSSISKMEAIHIKDRSLYQVEALSLIQLGHQLSLSSENVLKIYTIQEYSEVIRPAMFTGVSPLMQKIITRQVLSRYLQYLPMSLIQLKTHASSRITDAAKGYEYDLVSLEEPINIDINSDYIKDYDNNRPSIQLSSNVGIPSKFKSIVEKYAAALSSQVSGDTLFSEEAPQKKSHFTAKSSPRDHHKGVERATLNNLFKSKFQFTGDSEETALTVEQSIDLNREFEAARYQIQVTTHEGSNFSRSIFVFMLISLIFWALTRFFSFVIFDTTRNEACFYVPNSKRTLIWSKFRTFLDILS